jgi:hypothetical protein
MVWQETYPALKCACALHMIDFPLEEMDQDMAPKTGDHAGGVELSCGFESHSLRFFMLTGE